MQCSAARLGVEKPRAPGAGWCSRQRALLVLTACSAPHAPGAAAAAASLLLSWGTNCPTALLFCVIQLSIFRMLEDVLVPLSYTSQEKVIHSFSKALLPEAFKYNQVIMARGCSIQCSVLLHATAINSAKFSLFLLVFSPGD